MNRSKISIVEMIAHMGHLCSGRIVQNDHVRPEAHELGCEEVPEHVRKPAIGSRVVDKTEMKPPNGLARPYLCHLGLLYEMK